MPNQKYSQVTDLLVQGKLRWTTDAISALLFTDATFDANNTKVSDLGVRPVSTVPIMGRSLGQGGAALGYPATFNQADPEDEYQVIVAKDDGLHDLLLLAFIDVNNDGNPLTVVRPGSLIVRPVEAGTPLVDGQPTTGVWMRL
jgi:hypothetical protein